jgi:outer membrane lipoprotein-sorting protein
MSGEGADRFDRRIFLAILASAAFTTRIAQAAGAWRTLSGPFVQERTLGLFKSTVRSQGKVTLVRPDKLRWELSAPDEIVYWATADVLAYRSRAGSGRVPANAGRIAASMADLRALLGGDLASLRGRYEVKETASGDNLLLEAAPKEPAQSPFKKLTLELGPDRIRPLQAVLVEGPKDQSRIRFGDLVLDAPVDPRVMEPPPA